MSVDRLSISNKVMTNDNMYTQKLDIKENKNFVKVKYSEKTVEKNNNYSGELKMEDFEAVFKESNDKIQAFEDFINKISSYQGSKAVESRKIKINIKISIEELPSDINTEEVAPTEVEDYWGAEATSQRILDFAQNLAGENTDKYDLLLDAFKNGFEAAKECFGGELPEVCNETFDLVIAGFEQLKEEPLVVEEQLENPEVINTEIIDE